MRILLAATLFITTFVLQLIQIVIFRRMMKEVNDNLPGSARIPEIGPSWLQGGVFRLHRQFFPCSPLRKKVYVLWSVQTATFLGALACIVRFSQ